MTTSRLALAVTLAATVGGCDTNGEPELLSNPVLLEDVAMVAADAALGDVATMALPTVGAVAPSSAPAERSRSVEFFDENGDAMDGFDPLLTATLHIVVEVSGERDRGGWTATIERKRDFMVSGLAGEETERTWNGTSTGEVSGSRHSDENGDRSYEMTGSGTVQNVVVAVDREANPWPLSGTIIRVVKVERTGPDGTVERTREVVIVFDGTQFPPMTVDGEPFELDLGATDGSRHPFRRPGRS